MKLLLIFATLTLQALGVCAQTISVYDSEKGKYQEIDDKKIKNKEYPLPKRQIGLTVRISGSEPFTTTVNEGAEAIPSPTPGSSRTSSALYSIVPGSVSLDRSMVAGTAADENNFIKLKAVFQTVGFYTLTSDVKNGIRFYATGYADKAGQRDLKLQAAGTPDAPGSITVTLESGLTVPLNISGTAVAKATVSSMTSISTDGTFEEGKEADAANTITVSVVVTAAGSYNISSPVVNGIFYYISGKFPNPGTKTVVLRAFGTPMLAGTKKVKLTLGAQTIEANVPVAPAKPDIFTYGIPDNVNKIEFASPTGDKYVLINPTDGDGTGGSEGTSADGSAYEDYILTKYGDNLKLTPYGLLINKKIGNRPYLYGGANYVHIFLDELGNSLITSVPQGIPEMQYVVHVIYAKDNAGKKIFYGMKPTRGSFVGGNRIENGKDNTGELDATNELNLLEYTVVIKTATSDIDFDIYRFENGVKKNKLSYTITMTSAFTTSISVGLLNTQLRNPTFSLVNDPSNADLKVAKQTEGKNRGFGSVFATLYTSPITIIKYYLDRKKIEQGRLTEIEDPVANFQLHSKDYLYMRPVWERIYPTFGVGLNDKLFQNLFFGFNWEFARGGSLFLGGHYGKVNVFNSPKKFQFEHDNVTQDEFDLYQNIEWKVGWAFGASVDFKIIGNLFK